MLSQLLLVSLAISRCMGIVTPRDLPSDAPYIDPPSVMDAALTCPNGTANQNGIVLLVPGTGVSGMASWAAGPYPVYFPQVGLTVCWTNLPNNSLGDAQASAAYVAYQIKKLAPLSSTGQVAVVGHSQGGGLNIQWALLYWPSTRCLVSRYVSLCGDFHGTIESPLICTRDDLLHQGCLPAFRQQTAGSNYITAQNKRGNIALVPTTSIYTLTDDIVEPEIIDPSSELPGADNYAIQDLRVCGLLHVATHITMLTDFAAMSLAKLAITSGPGRTPIERFDPAWCRNINNALTNDVPTVVSAIYDQLENLNPNANASDYPGATYYVKGELPLKQYVCDQGDAPQSQCDPL